MIGGDAVDATRTCGVDGGGARGYGDDAVTCDDATNAAGAASTVHCDVVWGEIELDCRASRTGGSPTCVRFVTCWYPITFLIVSDPPSSVVGVYWYQLHSRTNDCNDSSYQRATFRPRVLHHHASVRRMGPHQHVTLLRSRCVQDEADLQAFRRTVYPHMLDVPHSLFDECERLDSTIDYVPHDTCGTCMARSPSHCHTYRWCIPCAFVDPRDSL